MCKASLNKFDRWMISTWYVDVCCLFVLGGFSLRCCCCGPPLVFFKPTKQVHSLRLRLAACFLVACSLAFFTSSFFQEKCEALCGWVMSFYLFEGGSEIESFWFPPLHTKSHSQNDKPSSNTNQKSNCDES